MNMRRTRREYQDSLPVHPHKFTFEEALAKVKRQIKRKAVADGLIVDPSKRLPRHTWHPTQLNEGLVERCIKFTTPPGEPVLDPFGGTGTTLRVCKTLGNPAR